jgi:hypothetical protein
MEERPEPFSIIKKRSSKKQQVKEGKVGFKLLAWA